MSEAENKTLTLEEWLKKGQEYYQTGNLELSQQCYQQALSLAPEKPDIYHALGIVALQSGAFELAKEYLLTAVTLNSTIADYHKDLSTVFHAVGDIENAIKSCNQALTLDPENIDALINMGVLLKTVNQFEQAIPFFEKAVLANKSDSYAIGELADIFNHLHRYNEAVEYAKAATTLDPKNLTATKAICHALRYKNLPAVSVYWHKRLIELEPDSSDNYVGLSKSLIDCGLSKPAEHFAKKAVKLDPNNAKAHSVYASTQARLTSWDQALESTNTAIKLAPEDEHYIDQKASLLELMGRAEEAFELIKPRVLGRKAINTDSLQIYTNLAKRFGHEKQAELLLEDIIHKPEIPPLIKLSLSSVAGHFYHSIKKYDKAFKYFAEANKLKPRIYHADATKDMFERIKATFNKNFPFHKYQRASSSRPIFIIGMPRSGTSLTEKILASHSKVSGAGELSKIKEIVDELPARLETEQSFPECVTLIDNIEADSMSDEYLEFIDELIGNDTPHFTDKMPQNFLYLAVIAIIFPNAKIIHCNRDPIDTCLSCFFQNFAADGLEFTYDLEALGHYYNLYDDLMRYWKSVLPIDIYESHYEKLVEDPKTEVEKLLHFCDLEWEDACMEHQKSDLMTKTASYNQVRQPIYKTSKQKWKKYERHIQPLINALEKYRNN